MTPDLLATLIGGGLALVIGGGLGTVVRFDRDRAFYPTMLIVVASLYVLFATLSTGRNVASEIALGSVFMASAVIGFRGSLWIVAVGLVGHGVLDAVHWAVVDNPGVPTWWPWFCGTYDVVAGGYLAWRLRGGMATREVSR